MVKKQEKRFVCKLGHESPQQGSPEDFLQDPVPSVNIPGRLHLADNRLA